MYLDLAKLDGLTARQAGNSSNSPNSQNDSSGGGGIKTSTVVFVVVAGVVTILLVGVVWVCFARKPRKSKIPGQPADKKKKKKNGFLGRITGRLGGGRYEQASAEDTDHSHQLSSARSRSNNGDQNTTQQNESNSGTVDRHTSVRSIATLPAYRQSANQNEQVLGREGERDGIDVIVDLPTQEAEEELREQEMETLYQIRTTRRQLIAERDERREQRRDARRRGDRAALDDIRARTRAANEDTTISDLRQQVEQIKDNRNRSVSSVSYADLGVARHDGTRIRANSTESERVGLLSDAASMSLGHQRNNSTADSDMLSLTPTRTRGDSLSIVSPYGVDSAGVSPRTSVIETDLGATAMPPPEYEDVPLSEENRSTTPMYDPPPDYPGPYRTTSHRSQRSLTSNRRQSSSSEESQNSARHEEVVPETENTTRPSPTRGVGGVPQLPSLRITRLPEIAIDPPSAHPQDNAQRENLS